MQKSSLADWMLAHRRMVVSLLLLLFFVLLALRYLGFPTLNQAGAIDWRSQVTATLDGLISTIVVSFVVAVTLWWTKPPLDRIPPGYEVPPTSISNTLETAAAVTNEWEYVGHTGRYVRSRIFPLLKKHSQQNNRPVRVRMTILDPRDMELCQRYADYRKRSRSSEVFKDDWTAEKVRDELVATVAATIELNSGVNHIQCEIRFRSTLSHFRFDVSDDQVMVTQEDPQEPAFSYPRGSRFYDYYKRENQLVWSQCEPVDIGGLGSNSVEVADKLNSELVAFMGSNSDSADIVARSMAILAEGKSPYA